MRQLLIIMLFVCGLLSSYAAFGQDGMRVATDKAGEYREFSGTRLDHNVYGSIGIIKAEDKVGAKLSIGPSFDGYSLLYGFSVVATDDERLYRNWNELEVLSMFEYFGISFSVVSDNALEFTGARYPTRLYLKYDL